MFNYHRFIIFSHIEIFPIFQTLAVLFWSQCLRQGIRISFLSSALTQIIFGGWMQALNRSNLNLPLLRLAFTTASGAKHGLIPVLPVQGQSGPEQGQTRPDSWPQRSKVRVIQAVASEVHTDISNRVLMWLFDYIILSTTVYFYCILFHLFKIWWS